MLTSDALLQIILTRSDHVLWLWVAYLVLASAFLVVMVRFPDLSADRTKCLMLSLSFLFVAFTHLECMRWVVKQWGMASSAFVETTAYTQASAEVKQQMDGVIHAPKSVWIIPFHLVLDFLVLGMVWQFRRRLPTMAGNSFPPPSSRSETSP